MFPPHPTSSGLHPSPSPRGSLPTTCGCPPSRRQQCPLAGGTGQKIAAHAKERSLDTLMHPFVSSSLITATPYALKQTTAAVKHSRCLLSNGDQPGALLTLLSY